jgi:hypothetical protein
MKENRRMSTCKRLDLQTLGSQPVKVETPIHVNIREMVTWECKEHGVKSWMCRQIQKEVLDVGIWILEAWAILHNFLKQGCCKRIFLSHRLIQNKQRNNCEATKMMARKVHVCIKNWEFHLLTPPKCQKLPSSIPKTAHVNFRATSCSLSITLWWYHRG